MCLIQRAPESNTVIVFLFDRGLHYGLFLPSELSEQGQAEPILYMKLPQKLLEESSHVLRQNAGYWTTPYNAHVTIFDVSFGNTQHQSRSRLYTFLLQLLT